MISVFLQIALFNLTIALFNLIGMSLRLEGPFVDWWLDKRGAFWVMGVGTLAIIIVNLVRW